MLFNSKQIQFRFVHSKNIRTPRIFFKISSCSNSKKIKSPDILSIIIQIFRTNSKISYIDIFLCMQFEVKFSDLLGKVQLKENQNLLVYTVYQLQ